MSDLDRFHAQEGLVFGFVPAQVVADLKDIGNWKVRACAIDALHRTLLNAKGKGDVARNLPELLDFLMALVGDPNFKISLSSMQIIGDLVAKVGRELSPFLGGLVPKLIEKLGDNKIMVRQAGIQVLRKLMAALGPMPVLDMLAQGRRHGSWRVREEVAIMHIMVRGETMKSNKIVDLHEFIT
ncbi:unnamed protein product [Ostreobium quekettii]|uniref:TOG domain-containing protein n=1 Tax=Ostreobium quekettii TaxID=121088 RepID=A0A8S1J520_9CHLO|nr:unnamed protein product [Ostreobium quekettii]